MGKWNHPAVNLTPNQKAVPYALQKLDAYQVASHCDISVSRLFALRGNGKISNKFFQFDHKETDWKMKNYCYRADIPQLKAEIAKAAPGPVTHIATTKEDNTMPTSQVTFADIASQLGLPLKKIYNLSNSNVWPAGFEPQLSYTERGVRKYNFDGAIIEALRAKLGGKQPVPKNDDIGQWLSTKQIADTLGVKDYTVNNIMRGPYKPKGIGSKRVGHSFYYEPKVVELLRHKIAKNPQIGRPHKVAKEDITGYGMGPVTQSTDVKVVKDGMAKAMQTVHIDIAAELIKEGHIEAGVYLIKKYA